MFPNLVVIPLLAPGIRDIEEGLLFQILPLFARYRQLLVIVGVAIIVSSVFLASYATMAVTIVLTLGVLFGVGGIILNFVHVSAFSEWFDKRQSQAMGIIWSGYLLGALAFPLICQALLDKLGFGATLRVLVSVMIALLLPSVFLLCGRYPTASVQSKPLQPPVSKLALFRNWDVVFYLLCTILFSAQMYIPLIFITKIGTDIGLDRSDQAIAESLLILALMFGTYSLGAVCNEQFRPMLLVAVGISSALVHAIILGLCKTKITLLVYALSIGLTSGGKLSSSHLPVLLTNILGWSNCLFAFYKDVSKNDQRMFTAVHSLFSSVCGIAALSNGPVGTALVNLAPYLDTSEYGLGKYKYLVTYAAGMPFLSGVLIFLRIFLQRHLTSQ